MRHSVLLRTLSLGALVTVLGSAACAYTCTLVGCDDGATLTVRTADDAWPNGAYTLSFTVGGQATECQLAWDGQLDVLGDPKAQITCDSSIDVSFQARFDSVSTTPMRLPGQFELIVTLVGTPAEVSLDVARDGAPVASHDFAMKYADVNPNGESCEPTCSEVAETWKMP